jgi:hypothetical protein
LGGEAPARVCGGEEVSLEGSCVVMIMEEEIDVVVGGEEEERPGEVFNLLGLPYIAS